jgi:hypothetical protein
VRALVGLRLRHVEHIRGADVDDLTVAVATHDRGHDLDALLPFCPLRTTRPAFSQAWNPRTLWTGFQDEIEGGRGGTPEASETALFDHVPQTSFAGLRTKSQSDFLAQ